MNSNNVPGDYFKENTELSDEDKKKAALWYPKPKIPGVPDPPKPQPPTLVTGGGIPSNDVEKDAPTDVSLKSTFHIIIITVEIFAGANIKFCGVATQAFRRIFGNSKFCVSTLVILNATCS